MKSLDLIIIFGYLIGIVVFGTWFGRKQKTTKDYFLGDRSVPWWAVAFSIVATETSTITFISVPGIAFARGGNFQFLQLVFGYLLGRVVISLLFIPSYFRGELMTVYQLLDRRFGGKIKMLAASLFVVMRNIADGIRLLLTAIVLAAVYTSFQPGANVETITVGSIVLIGVAMIIFTYFGGMEAVIWVEVVQLGIYIAGAQVAIEIEVLGVICPTLGLGEFRARRAGILIVLGVVDEVLPGEEAAFGPARRQGLGHDRRDARAFAGQDLVAVEVAAVGQGGDLLAARGLLSLKRHGRKLVAIVPLIGHLVGDDQMVLSVDGDLHIVADGGSAFAAGRHRSGVGIGQRDLLVGRGVNCLLHHLQGLHLSTQAGNLLLPPAR